MFSSYSMKIKRVRCVGLSNNMRQFLSTALFIWNELHKWFSTCFCWRHTLPQNKLVGTLNQGKLKKNHYYIWRFAKYVKIWRIKHFGGTPRRCLRLTGWEILNNIIDNTKTYLLVMNQQPRYWLNREIFRAWNTFAFQIRS